MKWFKHPTNKRMTNELVTLMDRFGHHVGYSSYFILMELCFLHFQNDKEFKLHEKILRPSLGLNSKKIELFFDLCNELNILTSKKIDKTYYVQWPELIDLVDEYTRKKIKSEKKLSGVYPDNNQTYKTRLDKNKLEEIKYDLIDLNKIINTWNNLDLNYFEKNNSDDLLVILSKTNIPINDHIEAINNYASVVHNPKIFFNFKWNLDAFLNSSNSKKFYPCSFRINSFSLNQNLQNQNDPSTFTNPFIGLGDESK